MIQPFLDRHHEDAQRADVMIQPFLDRHHEDARRADVMIQFCTNVNLLINWIATPSARNDARGWSPLIVTPMNVLVMTWRDGFSGLSRAVRVFAMVWSEKVWVRQYE